jgi:hypothetical protein
MGIISNVDWDAQTPEWREAARTWLEAWPAATGRPGPAGCWPATPLPIRPTLDVEWYADGHWELWRGDRYITRGHGRGRMWVSYIRAKVRRGYHAGP